jgi:phage shock protein E
MPSRLRRRRGWRFATGLCWWTSEPNEFDQGHLEGALLIPHDRIASRASELGDDKQRTIVLYCRSGNRSAQAKEALEKIGYTNVMNAGGYESLKQAQ